MTATTAVGACPDWCTRGNCAYLSVSHDGTTLIRDHRFMEPDEVTIEDGESIGFGISAAEYLVKATGATTVLPLYINVHTDGGNMTVDQARAVIAQLTELADQLEEHQR